MFRRNVEIIRIVLIAGRVDMRKGISGLVSLVRLQYGLDPIEKGTLFLFCGIKKDRIKGLLFEGDGFVISTKRLSQGRYCWPNTPNEVKYLTWEEYDRLMNGFPIESTIKSNTNQ